MYRFILLLLIMTLSLSVVAKECDLVQLQQKLKVSELNANFVQTKQIKALRRPLKSKGLLYYTEEKGLVWQVTAPIKGTTLLTSNSLLQFDSKDRLLEQQQGQATAISNELSSIFLNLMTADFVALEPHFTIVADCSVTPERWKISLLPKNGPLADFFKEIKLSGGQSIEKVEMTELRGDLTSIELSYTQTSNRLHQLEQYFDRKE